MFNKRRHLAGDKALPSRQWHLGDRQGGRTSVHLLSSAMLPTRVASNDCSMVLNSDWLNMGSSPGLLARCGSRWRFRLSGRHSTPAVGGRDSERNTGGYYSGSPKRGAQPCPASHCTGTGVGATKPPGQLRLQTPFRNNVKPF